MTVTEFVGGTLPAGWSAVAPAGSSVDLPGDYLQLTIQPGETFNSLSGGVDEPQGPLVWRELTGAFDLAVGLAEEPQDLPNQGLDVLALNAAMGGIRLGTFCGAQDQDFRQDIGWFIRDDVTEVTHLNTAGDVPMGGLYGGPGWMRLAWDGVDTWTCYASHTGRSGSWHTISQFTSTFVPARFALAALAFPSGADGRVQRIPRVVDLLARGSDDATDPPDVGTASTLHSTDFSGGSLPSWLTPSTANGGSISTDTSGAELSIDESQTASQAWLVGPTDLPTDHGMLLQYQLTSAGYVNAFWVPAVALATSTDVPGAEALGDKWGDGTSLAMEMPAREHAAQGQLLRLLRRSPIPAGASQSGDREFDGYTLMIEDDTGPVGTVGTPLTWLRIERAGHEVRVRLWLDGDPEPATWHYRAQDHMRHGTGIALTLSHNDSVSGTGTASVRFSQVEVYDLSPAASGVAGSGTSHAAVTSAAVASKLGTGTGRTPVGIAARAHPTTVRRGRATSRLMLATRNAPAAAPPPAAETGGGWETLLTIRREAAQLARAERSAPPRACPYDGEPLRSGPHGQLHCPWGDYLWPRDGRPELAGSMW